MPINLLVLPSLKFGAIWTYIPNEYIDFNNYSLIQILRIECFEPSELLEPSNNHQIKIYPRGAMSHYYSNWSTTPPHVSSSENIENIPYILPSIKKGI